jgi:hypothetical protein
LKEETNKEMKKQKVETASRPKKFIEEDLEEY